MNKIGAFIFFANYILMSATASAKPASFDFDGNKHTCEQLSTDVMKCNTGKKDVLVIKNNAKYIVYDQFDPLHTIIPSKVKSNGELEYFHEKDKKNVDTLEFQHLHAQVLLSKTKNLNDSFSQLANKQTSNFIKNSPEYFENLRVVLNKNETFNCSRGETSHQKNAPTSQKELNDLRKNCTYYSCIGNDPAEKVLFYMPPTGSNLVGPSVIAMKNGQARYYDDNFTVLDNSNKTVSDVVKSNYTRHEYYPSGASFDFPVNPKHLIPTKYNASSTSYDYFQSFAHGGQDPFGTRAVCKGDELNNLFNEQKKIASEMKDYLAYADIISYVTAINGKVRAAYIDIDKAQELGCSYQDKIFDYSALPELQRIIALSGESTQKKYPSESDVQNLFKQALQMEDIPFGYKEDGCFARAHIIARRFEKMGYTVKKAWIKGSLSVPGTNLNWRYHVAPLIEAKDRNGLITQFVIDPSLTDKAVTLDDWVTKMDKGVSGPVMKTTYPIAENGLMYQRTVVAVSSSDAYLSVDNKFITEDEKNRNATETLANHTDILKSLQF